MYRYMKEAVDRLLAVILIVAAMPLLLVIIILNWIINNTNPIYRGLRVGHNGKDFYIIKIRTLKEGSEKGGLTTSQNDKRLLKMGKF